MKRIVRAVCPSCKKIQDIDVDLSGSVEISLEKCLDCGTIFAMEPVVKVTTKVFELKPYNREML